MQKDKSTAENAVCDDSWWVNFVRNDTACTKEACFLFGKCVQVTEKKVGLWQKNWMLKIKIENQRNLRQKFGGKGIRE